MEVVRPPGAWDPHRLPDARRRPGAWDPHSPARCLGSSQCPGMPLHTPKPPGSGRQRTRVPAAARPRALSKCQRTRVPTARLQGPFPMPADAHPPAAHLRGPFPMPALSRCPRTRGNGPFPNARGSASPLQLPDAQGCASPPPPAPGEDARPRRCAPRGPFLMSAGGWQQGSIRAALACSGRRPVTAVRLRAALAYVRQPPSVSKRLWRASGRRPAMAICLWAALACVWTDRHAVLLRAALGCVQMPGNRRPPPGGLGMHPDAARQLCLRAAWASGHTPNLPGGGRRLPDAHHPFNLPYLETFTDMITINRKSELPTQK
jgi:hypothetical protein